MEARDPAPRPCVPRGVMVRPYTTRATAWVAERLREVAFGEGATGAGLQVPLERDSALRMCKLQ